MYQAVQLWTVQGCRGAVALEVPGGEVGGDWLGNKATPRREYSESYTDLHFETTI